MRRRDGESIPSYKLRLLLGKEDGLIDATWGEIADLPEFGCGEDYLRRMAKGCKLAREASDGKSKSEDKLNLYDAAMERVRARDERSALNKSIRDTARFERRLDEIEQYIVNRVQPLYHIDKKSGSDYGDDEMIVCLSDLHIGAKFDNVYGKYNVDIAKKRLADYLTEIAVIANRHHVRKVTVAVLGDLISGSIHKTIAVTNEEDVVTQTMLAADMVCQFVYHLSEWFDKVDVHCVAGNHSRVEQGKDDALRIERLDRIVPWYIKTALEKCSNVTVLDAVDPSFDNINVCGKTYFLVHGDFDIFSESGLAKLTAMNKEIPYGVLCAHMHHPAYNSLHGVHMIQSGSLCGSGDEYTVQRRLSGTPNQTVVVCDGRGIVCPYFIDLGGDDDE